MKKKIIQNSSSPAETLLEVIIAIGMIAMGAAIAAQLTVTSLQTISYNKDALVAMSLAQEGIEYMRNLRDTNFLKFSSDTDCWNAMPSEKVCSENSERIQAKFYVLGDEIKKNDNYSFETDLDLETNKNHATNFLLKYFDVTQNGNNSAEKHVLASFISAKTEVADSPYYRSVGIKYFYFDGQSLHDSDNNNGNIILVTSKVQWFGMGRVNTVKLMSSLSKHR